MSASQELLAEQLRQLDTRINELTQVGEDTASLEEQRQELLDQLARVNEALNEGTGRILKG